MLAKVQPQDVLIVRVGDVVGITKYTIGGPATGGRYSVPAVDRAGTGFLVVGLVRQPDAVTGRSYLYAEVDEVEGSK